MIHEPVLTKEVINIFDPQSGDTLLDATLGHGGHSKEFLKASSPAGKIVGIDADPDAVVVAKKNLEEYKGRTLYLTGNFANIKDLLRGGEIVDQENDSPKYTHILFDLGLGSHQLADPKRSFSFKSDADLTMQYGPVEKLPESSVEAINMVSRRIGKLPDAIDLIQNLNAIDLANIIKVFGEERYARSIAEGIKKSPVTTGKQLADRIAENVPPSYRSGRIHPATRTFQALRLAVNRELEVLQHALNESFELLTFNGVVAVISFHSLEDRIVKNTFKDYTKRNSSSKLLTKKPNRASQIELSKNPRARSAKLRALQKESKK